jgi:transposase-like protein
VGPFGKESVLSQKRRKFSPEYREEAVKLVIETSRPVAQVARELGLVEGTLGNWVNAYRREHAGEEPALTLDERARLREQERELRELRQKVAFLEKVAAYFAKDPR